MILVCRGRMSTLRFCAAVAVFGVSLTPAYLQGQTAGLVAAYSFNEGSGTTVNDSSGNGHNGVVQNTTWTSSGKYGQALRFNGTNALVTISDSAGLHLTGAMTLEAWVNSSTVTNFWRDVIYKGVDNYYLEATSDKGTPGAGGTFGGADVVVYGKTKLTVNTWAHLAETYDGATLRLYVNGVLVSSLARTGAITTSASALQIGGDTTYAQYFAGTIDEVRIYNVNLTAAQIQADMNTAISPDTQPPTAPSNLVPTATSGTQVNLAWTASTDNVGVTGYMVERCQGPGCLNFAQIVTVTAASYGDANLLPGTTYSYRVRATDAAGNLSSYSNIASVSTQAPDTQPPTAPSNLVPTATSGTQVTLVWTASIDNVGVAGYMVERCQGLGCLNFSQIATASATTYGDANLSPNTTYGYRVRATDAAGNLSSYSNQATVTTQASDTQPPTTPTNLTATPVSGSEIDLSWTASTDNVAVTGYLIERCQGAGCSTFSRLFTIPGTTYNDTGLSPNTSYTYHVKATDAAGNFSGYSNLATATTLTISAPAPVAAYAFAEGTGTTANDTSGNVNTGTLVNATWTTAGKYGNALVFNGTNAIVTVKDAPSLHLTNAMTLEAWVNPSVVNSTWRDVIYKTDDNYYLEATSTTAGTPAGGGTFGTADVQAYGTAALPANTWSHLAVTYDATTVRLYVNGVQVGTKAQSGAILTSTNALQIGGDTLYRQYFSGMLDEIRIYNVALTAAQIQQDMGAPIFSSPAPFVTLSSTSMTFGNQTTGSTSAAQTVTLTNTGSATLNINAISLIGLSAGDFNQTSTCGTTVAPNGNCTISVTFTPTTTGTRLATVNIATNTLTSPQTISLSGTGTGFSVTPRYISLTFTRTQQFTASSTGVSWSVDGVPGGSPSSGTITASGLYTPPLAAGAHIVTATTADQSQTASATAFITNYAGVFTYHYDNLRTGQNTSETVLTPASVNQIQFGKLFSFATDGLSYASPLYVANVNIPAQGYHNVVYVATEHDSVYAFDADGLSATPLWKVSFINPAAGITTVPANDTGECCDIPNEIGISSTPAIDPATGTLYVLAKTKEVSGSATNYVQRLHALDIATGAEKFGGPVVLQASVNGTGDGASGGKVQFDSLRENQRPALLLSNGVVYMAFGSHGDVHPWHGWVLGYNATTLQQVLAYNNTANGFGGGIWQSGGGIATDASGNLFFTSSNGTFNLNTSGVDAGDTIQKLSPNGTLLDYFTPHDQATMEVNNIELGSAGPVLVIDQPGPFPHLLVAAGKEGTVYVINRDNMGHYNPNNDNQAVQSLVNILPNGPQDAGNFSAPAYFNGFLYFAAINDALKAFQMTNGLLSPGPMSQSSVTYPNRGGSFSVSANGSSNGIVWAVQDNSPSAGVLRAYDANNLSNELYNSSQAGTRDTLSVAAKFNVPTAANGKVYVVTSSQLVIYGLLP